MVRCPMPKHGSSFEPSACSRPSSISQVRNFDVYRGSIQDTTIDRLDKWMDVDATLKSNGWPAGGGAIEQERKHDTTSQPTTAAAGTKPRWLRRRSKPTSAAASILFLVASDGAASSWWRAMEERLLSTATQNHRWRARERWPHGKIRRGKKDDARRLRARLRPRKVTRRGGFPKS